MELLKTLIWVVNIISALSIVILVLMQHGKGADMGAAFGGGSSGSLFGASGSANFMSRTTAVLAVIFFSTSLGLVYLTGNKTGDLGVMAGSKAVQVQKTVPLLPSGTVTKKINASGAQIPE